MSQVVYEGSILKQEKPAFFISLKMLQSDKIHLKLILFFNTNIFTLWKPLKKLY